MDEFIEAAEAEERRLSEELSHNPIFVRLQALKSLLRTYRLPVPEASTNGPGFYDWMKVTRAAGPRPGSKAAQIRPLVLDYLTKKGGRAQTAELLAIVTQAGVEIGGQKPSGTMSSYLSNMDELDHRQGEGYGLKEVAEPEADAQIPVSDSDPAPTGGKTDEIVSDPHANAAVPDIDVLK